MPGVKISRKEKDAAVSARLRQHKKQSQVHKPKPWPKVEMAPLPDPQLLDTIAKNHAKQDYQSSKKPNPASIHSTPIGRDVKADRPLPEFKPAKVINGGTDKARKVKPPYQLSQCMPDYVESYQSGLREAKIDGYSEPEIPTLPCNKVERLTKIDNNSQERKPDYRWQGSAYENLQDWKPGQK